MVRWIVTLGLFAGLLLLLAVGLQRDPREVPSPLIGKALPAFNLEFLQSPGTSTETAGFDEPYLLNVWASWCVACRDEHPVLLELARKGVPVIGLNYKDSRSNGLHWLEKRGDPYRYTLFDPDGVFGLDLGVYGVPETFVVGADGVILHKHIGPLTHQEYAARIEPLLRKPAP